MYQQYNPNYDPLIDTIPGPQSHYAPSYWTTTAGTPPEDDGAVTKDMDIDVAIIGGGFTGLATALFLAREHGIQAHVFEANQAGWGCTSRNGGQGHLAWGRMSRSQWVHKWGTAMAKKIHNNTLEGFAIFTSLTEDPDIDCQPFGNGNVVVAHSASALEALRKESQLCNQVLGYNTQMIDTATVHNTYMNDAEACGALVEPCGIAVQPLKLAFGYMQLARRYGAKVHPASPIVNWQENNAGHYLQTPQGIIKARSVVVATAGYTHPSLHPLLAYRNMPIMANSAVTAELTDAQIAECGFGRHIYLTDSRKLRYYYRYLPEKRLQIGTRSAVTGADANNPKHLQIVYYAIARKFPALQGTAIEYFWSGWMDISHDMMPRIVQPDAKKCIFYAQGYSGNGVAFSAYAASRLAMLVAGKTIAESDLPIFTSPLPTHPLRPFRRMGQRLLFHYYNHLDRKP